MPNAADLVLKDRNDADVTFHAARRNGNVQVFADRTAATVKGQRLVSVEPRDPAAVNGARRVFINLTLPKEGLVDGVTKVVKLSSGQVILNLSQEAEEGDIRDLMAFLKNSLDNPSIQDVALYGEGFF